MLLMLLLQLLLTLRMATAISATATAPATAAAAAIATTIATKLSLLLQRRQGLLPPPFTTAAASVGLDNRSQSDKPERRLDWIIIKKALSIPILTFHPDYLCCLFQPRDKLRRAWKNVGLGTVGTHCSWALCETL